MAPAALATGVELVKNTAMSLYSKSIASAPKLTPRQRQILQLIEHAIERYGAPPTRAEIAAEFGFKSPNAAEEHLRALARKGVIELVSGTSRGIRLKGSSSDLPAAHTQALLHNLPLAVPLIGRVAAGLPILAQQHVEQVYHLERSLFAHYPDYLLRVRGQSMRGAGILDGDLLAVRQAHEAQQGQIVVARLDEDVTVKRFYRESNRIRLHAENPDFDDIIVGSDQPFQIEGLAVGLIRDGGFDPAR
jgi:repressor LexA